MKNFLPLCAALVDALLLLEHSSSDEVDPDVAVRGMENMSSSLHQLDEMDQHELRLAFYEIAEQSPDLAYKKFVLSVPEMMGLAE